MEPTPPPTSDLISLYQDWQEAAVRAKYPRIARDRKWDEYPIGTKAYSFQGGYWIRTGSGWWRWMSGDAFPAPGADAIGNCVELPPPKLLTTSIPQWKPAPHIEDWQEAAARISLDMGAAKDLLFLSEYQDRAQRRWLCDCLWGPTIGRTRRRRRARGRRKRLRP
jgi:hypothetical protein